MHFYHRRFYCLNGIPQGYTAVCIAASIQNNPIHLFIPCVNLIDKFPLHITLKIKDIHIHELSPESLKKVLKASSTINRWFTLTQ